MVPKVVEQSIVTKFGAACLNGDPPTFEIKKNKNSKRWILFLEGGGWCYGASASDTIKSCAARAGIDHNIESLQLSNDYGGILGFNSTTNPDFHQDNFVFIHYCDGASFGSNRPSPIKLPNGKEIWMRGRPNFDSVITDLITNYGMSSATEVILSGGSAGGLAVFYNLDHLAKDLLPKNVRVTGFPDAGFFMDAPNYVQDFKGANPVWNVTESNSTNINCLNKYVQFNEEWKCLLAPYILEFIETPIFVMNSAFDAWQISNNNVGCVSTQKKPCNDTSVQMYGKEFKLRVYHALKNKTKRYNTSVGAYIDSCYVHEQNVNYCSAQRMPNCVGWSPLESGSKKWNYTTAIQLKNDRSLTPQQAFSKYYFSTRMNNSISLSMLNNLLKDDTNILIDSTTLQNNSHCVYNGVPPSFVQDTSVAATTTKTTIPPPTLQSPSTNLATATPMMTSNWEKVLMVDEAKSNNAICLDGSPGGYYIRRNTNSDNWIIFHQGGGWCGSPENCLMRSNTTLGSSTHWPPTYEDVYEGSELFMTPPFDQYNIVYAMYCDGGSWSGNSIQVVNNTTIHYRGRNLLDSLLQNVVHKQNMSNAKNVLYSGCSAGGLTTFLHADYVNRQLKMMVSTDVKVLALADAMFSLNHNTFLNVPRFQNMMKWGYEAWNSSSSINQRCLQHYGKTEGYNCMFGEYASLFINTPTMIINSKYDSWQQKAILGLNCSPKTCANNQMKQFWFDYGTIMVKAIHSVPSVHGIFLTNCVAHCQTGSGGDWSKRTVNGTTLSNAVAEWYNATLNGKKVNRWISECVGPQPCGTDVC
jgi:O-palmitoleoyl-L-serine hydrolase